jgi:tetratricopeptide (TPR) repeat protein
LQAEKLFNKALAAFNRNNARSARKIALKLTKIDQENFSAWHLRAAIHGKLGEIPHAENAFIKAASLAPTIQERAQVYEQLGKFLMENQLPEKAATYFTKLQLLAPGRADVSYYLAESLRLSRQFQLALVEYDKAITLSDVKPEILIRKADCLRKLGETREAINCLTQISVIDPVDVDMIAALVACYIDIDAFGEAERLLQEAVEIDPGNAHLHYELALLYRSFGELNKAANCFEKTLALAPDAATVYYNYSRVKQFDADDPIIEKMQHCLAKLPAREETNSQLKEKTELLFALGKMAEDCRQYEKAFDYWQNANVLKRRTFEYQIGDDRKRVAAIKKVFDTKLINDLQLEPSEQPTPIFIVGMPRAGSTLCEQILSSHADIYGMGELTLLPELIGELEKSIGLPFPRVMTQVDKRQLQALRDNYRAFVLAKTDRHYFTDKLPGNLWLVGLAKILFPRALFIHAHRDPIDTGFSCYKHLFSGAQKFAYDLVEIRQYIQLCQALMTFWHELLPGAIYDLKYEDLVANPQDTVKSMLSFCDLPWQQDCLHFWRTRRAVKSSSAAQIRQPLYAGAVGYWRHYEDQLQALTEPR